MSAPSDIAAATELLTRRALAVRERFAAFERSRIGREWSTAEIMSGFVVDVGDLMRLVMAASGARHLEDVPSRLAHELADCLWCVLVLADRLEVDLAAAFDETMTTLEAHLDAWEHERP